MPAIEEIARSTRGNAATFNQRHRIVKVGMAREKSDFAYIVMVDRGKKSNVHRAGRALHGVGST
jgi:hypothetical protein